MPSDTFRHASDRAASSTQRAVASRILATGGVLGTLLASSCCVVPLSLVTLGIGGTWMGNLIALEPYKPYFVSAALVFLALGHWHVHVANRSRCEVAGDCANPVSNRLIKTVLWSASTLLVLTMTIDYWAPFFY